MLLISSPSHDYALLIHSHAAVPSRQQQPFLPASSRGGASGGNRSSLSSGRKQAPAAPAPRPSHSSRPVAGAAGPGVLSSGRVAVPSSADAFRSSRQVWGRLKRHLLLRRTTATAFIPLDCSSFRPPPQLSQQASVFLQLRLSANARACRLSFETVSVTLLPLGLRSLQGAPPPAASASYGRGAAASAPQPAASAADVPDAVVGDIVRATLAELRQRNLLREAPAEAADGGGAFRQQNHPSTAARDHAAVSQHLSADAAASLGRHSSQLWDRAAAPAGSGGEGRAGGGARGGGVVAAAFASLSPGRLRALNILRPPAGASPAYATAAAAPLHQHHPQYRRQQQQDEEQPEQQRRSRPSPNNQAG